MKEKAQILLELENKALTLKNAGDWAAASQLFEQILAMQPDWEHGYGLFNLAECYEESGKLSQARSAYERAVEHTPTDPIILGAFASFLYMHGDPAQAFQKYSELLTLEKKRGDADQAANTMIALKTLGLRMGWSEVDVNTRIVEYSKSRT
jgi:Tfp pilus assembly protein PilF